MKSKLFHVQLTVFCDKCGHWEYIDGTSKVDKAIKVAISNGWKLDRKESEWSCPKCNEQKKGERYLSALPFGLDLMLGSFCLEPYLLV
jgi:predicted nucleic-acid-binding Zn-ribbon protein